MSDTPQAWPVLNFLERRLLGVLVEKAKTTPDAYPLSLNSLIAGCNQKSNRDPIMNIDDIQVEEALEQLQAKGLVMRVMSGRVDRWRQLLYEVWLVSKTELAVLAELLLRGPQTEGELRGRAARMEPIDDIDQLRAILRPLAERRLIVYLTPERSRGTMVTHGFHAPEELARLQSLHSTGVAGQDYAPAPRAAAPAVARPELNSELERFENEMKQIRAELERLKASVEHLQQSLGVLPPA